MKFSRMHMALAVCCVSGIGGSALAQAEVELPKDVKTDFVLIYDFRSGARRMYDVATGKQLKEPVVVYAGKTVAYRVINCNPFLHSVSGKNDHVPLDFKVPDGFKSLVDGSVLTGVENAQTPEREPVSVAPRRGGPLSMDFTKYDDPLDRAAGGLRHLADRWTDLAAAKKDQWGPGHFTVRTLPGLTGDSGSTGAVLIPPKGDPVPLHGILEAFSVANRGKAASDPPKILNQLAEMFARRAESGRQRAGAFNDVVAAIENAKLKHRARKTAIGELKKSALLLDNLKSTSRSNDSLDRSPGSGRSVNEVILANMGADAARYVAEFGGAEDSWQAIEAAQKAYVAAASKASGESFGSTSQARERFLQLERDILARIGRESGSHSAIQQQRSRALLEENPNLDLITQLTVDAEFHMAEELAWRELQERLPELDGLLDGLESESAKLDETLKESIPKSNDCSVKAIALYRAIENCSFEKDLSGISDLREGTIKYTISQKLISEDGKLTDDPNAPPPFEYEVVDGDRRRPFFGLGYIVMDNLGHHRDYVARATTSAGGTTLTIQEGRRESVSTGLAGFAHFPIRPRDRGDIDAISFGYAMDAYLVGYTRAFGSKNGSTLTAGFGLRNFQRLNGMSEGDPVENQEAIRTKKVLMPTLFLSLQFRF